MTTGCGSSESGEGHAAEYPAGISDDIAKLLKYDARVQSFSEDGDTLDVEVNDEWMAMPQGMQERAMGHWFSIWKSSHGAKARVVVRYGGSEISSYTADKGFQPAPKPKEEESA
jgi:hypothetical protein